MSATTAKSAVIVVGLALFAVATYLDFVPAAEPTIFKRFDSWFEANPLRMLYVGLTVGFYLLIWVMDLTHTQTHKELEALNKQCCAQSRRT
jgi:hypothetical protein